MTYPKGAKVRQIVPVIEGEVAERRFNETADEVEYLIGYATPEGEVHQRWFLGSQLTLVSEVA